MNQTRKYPSHIAVYILHVQCSYRHKQIEFECDEMQFPLKNKKPNWNFKNQKGETKSESCPKVKVRFTQMYMAHEQSYLVCLHYFLFILPSIVSWSVNRLTCDDDNDDDEDFSNSDTAMRKRRDIVDSIYVRIHLIIITSQSQPPSLYTQTNTYPARIPTLSETSIHHVYNIYINVLHATRAHFSFR